MLNTKPGKSNSCNVLKNLYTLTLHYDLIQSIIHFIQNSNSFSIGRYVSYNEKIKRVYLQEYNTKCILVSKIQNNILLAMFKVIYFHENDPWMGNKCHLLLQHNFEMNIAYALMKS